MDSPPLRTSPHEPLLKQLDRVQKRFRGLRRTSFALVATTQLMRCPPSAERKGTAGRQLDAVFDVPQRASAIPAAQQRHRAMLKRMGSGDLIADLGQNGNSRLAMGIRLSLFMDLFQRPSQVRTRNPLGSPIACLLVDLYRLIEELNGPIVIAPLLLQAGKMRKGDSLVALVVHLAVDRECALVVGRGSDVVPL